MKTLITGGAGFIGSHLADKLIERGEEVFIIDNLSTGKKENINPKSTFYKADICNFEEIAPLFKDIDIVFHLAAIPRVPVSVKDPIGTSKVNIMGAVNVFKACFDAKVKRVVFASSSSVYGDQPTSPLKEDLLPDPISPYGLQKWVGEKYAKIFSSDLYNLPIVSLRYFNVYGPRIDVNSGYSLVLGKFLKQKQEGEKLTIFGDGEQTRGFCYVADVVEANIKASTSNKIKGGEVINIGNTQANSVNYLADLIGGEKQYLPKRAGDILHTAADVIMAQELLDWTPKVDFDEGVKKTMDWFKGL